MPSPGILKAMRVAGWQDGSAGLWVWGQQNWFDSTPLLTSCVTLDKSP